MITARVSTCNAPKLIARSASSSCARQAFLAPARTSTSTGKICAQPGRNRLTWTPSRHFSQCTTLLHASPVEHMRSGQTAPPLDNHNVKSSTSSSSSETETPMVSVNTRDQKVSVTWSSGIESHYHNIWLRDHCRCADCYHPQTKQRQLDTFSIPADIRPHDVEATTEGLLIHWPKISASAAEQSKSSYNENVSSETSNPQATASPQLPSTTSNTNSQPLHDDLHASLYPWSWLYANSYAPFLSLGGAQTNQRDSSSMIMWGKGIAQQPPTVTYDEVMSTESDRGVARWTSKIARFGFCFVSGVPPTPEDTEALVKRIAFIRETHYGGFWDFTSDLSHGDTAYTNLPLGAHTDTTYFTDPAGLQLFHLLSHTPSVKDNTPAEGGASLLVDGFFAASILREVHPEAYRTLSSTAVSTHSAGDDATLIRPLQSGGYPILEHDNTTGELTRVRYNNDDRSVLRVREEAVLPFYDALRKWNDILRHKDSEYWSQLEPGTALIFDNHRVLHGRSAFTGNRRLCGAYVNHDDYRSRAAVLLKQFPELAMDSALSVRRGASNVSGSTSMSASTTPSTSIENAASRAYAMFNPAKNKNGKGNGGQVTQQQSQTTRRGVWDDGI